MTHNVKKQDLFGIFAAIGITIIAVSVGLGGNMLQDESQATSTQSREITGIGGITETKESIRISFENESIDLDSSDGLLRANVAYEGFQPQMGRVLLGVYSSTGEKIKESELQLRQRGNGVYEADIMQYFDKNDFKENSRMLGQHILRVSTDNGSLAKQVPFNVVMSSQEQPKQSISVQSNTGIGGVLPDKTSQLAFDLGLMEKSLEDTIIKKYLSKILMEYYDGTLSKEDMKKLTQFDSINCELTDQKSQTGEALQLSCEMKPNN